MPENKIEAVDVYINNCPDDIQPRLQELRRIILEVEPNMTQKISWQMPTFHLNGNVIHFAAHKKHIGLYPGVEAIEFYAERLKEYKTSKGAIQIPNDKPFDVALIQDIVKYNVELNKK